MLCRNPSNVVSLVMKMMIEGTDVGGRCMQGNNGTQYLIENGRTKLWKACMSEIMNEDNEWDQIVDADAVEVPIERVMREEIMEAFTHLKIGMAPGPSEFYAEMILVGGDIGISVDGTFPENTRWKRNACSLCYQCCNSYFQRKGRYDELWHV